MNTRLVDSLVQIIESLTPEERIFLQERLSSKPIQVTAGVCGGQPRIRNTRIPVWTLVAFRQQGANEEGANSNPPHLLARYKVTKSCLGSDTAKSSRSYQEAKPAQIQQTSFHHS
ncbi:DUF433 domain-containing protein [Dendronalium sp. ChiSLP03b]|uniref:DUF433 domain-containing protein n=1 Tax=Dendronalium sp. ChiSLP03b TaxID=3075381 RepID=UPI002AD230B6|nr:DUF433 domain-containing protein [Dendronalium sp. ChiSLP03b]MDZ8207444.1 DUF433 domain-containing protein [Dendronalium sp. ChiSLP03b]